MTTTQKEVSIKDFNEFKNKTKLAVVNREGREKWLNSVENGKIGEAKTKYQLLKRGLWILEREVDVNGADLIVQKASLLSDLIDIVGAPVAFVQTKNVGKDTSVIIDSRYIYYVDGEEIKTKDEFFVFIYRNDIPDFLVFLTAKDIDEHASKNKCSKFYNTSTDVTYIKYTPTQLIEINSAKNDTIEVAVHAVEEALSEAEYNRMIGLRHFLGLKPNEEETKNILNKQFYHNYDERLIESYLNTRLFLYKQLELYSVWPFVIKDILTQLDDPRELADRIPSLSRSVEVYKNQIKDKWNQIHPELPSDFSDHKDLLLELETAISNTIGIHQEGTREGEEDDDEQ